MFELRGELHWGDRFRNCDYRRMEEHDQYELVSLDKSLEDERDLDQIMADRRAAEIKLEARDAATAALPTLSHCKLPHLLHDQGISKDRMGKEEGDVLDNKEVCHQGLICLIYPELGVINVFSKELL